MIDLADIIQKIICNTKINKKNNKNFIKSIKILIVEV